MQVLSDHHHTANQLDRQLANDGESVDPKLRARDDPNKPQRLAPRRFTDRSDQQGGALLAGSAGHPVNGYIETADTVETSRNSGVWKAPPNIYDSGTASSATSTTLVDSSKTWTVNAHSGRRLAIKTRAGSGQARGISSNTATTITLAGAGNTWAVTPDATSTYQIDDGYSIGDSGGIGVHPAPNGHVAMAVPVATAAASFSV